jgi:15-cis-phytoene synthase
MAATRSEQERREDLRVCHGVLATGSKSFTAATRMLPKRLRDRVAALYGFCRLSDDAVDLGTDVQHALAGLHDRLARIYAGQPHEHPVDRAFCDLVREIDLPRAIPAALLDGFAWDAERRRYPTAEALEGYCARVASTVGVMMSLVMGARSPKVLARNCDLGLAMQITNICRDVGEDARAGRIYLPLDWLAEAGIDADAFVAQPAPSPALAAVVKRALALADKYYRRADGGLALLPRDCRLAVRAARLIYSDIGRVIARNRYDSVTRRAYTSKARKLLLLLRAWPAALRPGRPNLEPPAPAVQFLIDAVPE